MADKYLTSTHFGIAPVVDNLVFRLPFPLGSDEVAEIAEVRLIGIEGITSGGGSSTAMRLNASLWHSERAFADPSPSAQTKADNPNMWFHGGWWGAAGGLTAEDYIFDSTLIYPYPPGWYIGGEQFGLIEANGLLPAMRIEVWYYRVKVPTATKLWVVANTVHLLNPMGSQRG